MASKLLDKCFTCSICFETFDENWRRPRMLICGHTFCSLCLNKLCANGNCCPNCKADIYRSPELIPINYALEDMKSAILDADKKHSSFGFCQEHGSSNELRCMDCKKWICGMCGTLFHKNCVVILADKYNNSKEEAFQFVSKELKATLNIKDNMALSLEIYKEKRKGLLTIMGVKQKELMDCEKEIEVMESCISLENDLFNKLKQYSSSIVDLNEDTDLQSAKHKLTNLIDQGRKQVEKLLQHISKLPLTLQNLTISCLSEPVYAVSGALYGEMNVKHGKIWISCFQTEKPAARLIPFEELLTNFNESQMTNKTFLQLIPEGEDEGSIDIIIKTVKDSKAGKRFLLLCSALKILNYKGLTLTYWGGFPSYQLSSKSPDLLLHGVYGSACQSSSMEEGLVYDLCKDNSSFGISLIDMSSSLHTKIGDIVSGLQKLKELHKTGKNLLIKCSGLVI